jgi:hypothetical protein
VKATNQYGSAKFKENWESTNDKEMNYFFAAVIYMGINVSPTLKHYWAADTRSPFVTALFPSRDRFLRLNRCFYIATGERDTTDPIWHVRPLVTSLTSSFPRQYDPPQTMVIDESMVPCKARSKLKQYIKAKPYKWGYKLWCLAAEGYLIQFIIYQGKRASQDNETPAEVVTRLAKPYYGLHHIIVMDGLFTSPTLFGTLLRHSTYALGTARPNRIGFSKELPLELPNLVRGEWRFRQKEHLVAYLFLDRNPVYFLSTFHYPSQTVPLSRRLRTGEHQHYTVPLAVSAYNSARSGVDTLDQLQSYYSMARKSRRWWPRLAWWLIDMCIINSYKLYKLKNNSKISLLQFREQLMHELAGDVRAPLRDITNKRPRQQNSSPISQHWPARTQDVKDCVYCRTHLNRRSQVKFKCKSCDIYLCIDPCFELFHTLQ